MISPAESRELEELRARLEDAELAIESIRSGKAEALVIEGPEGSYVYSLENANRSYRVLVESMNEGAVTIAENGLVYYCNRRFAAMVQEPTERIMGSMFQRFLNDASRSSFHALLQNALGCEGRLEIELSAAQRATIPVQLSASAILDGEAGQQYCLILTDLRSQKRNDALVAAGHLARSVLDQSSETILVCDRTGTVVRASVASTHMCGRDPLLSSIEKVLAAFEPLPSAGNVVLPTTAQLGIVAAAMEGRALRALPGTLHAADGIAREVLLSASPLREANGAIIGCVINLVDVTEQQRSEREAQRQSELLSEALRQADHNKNRFIAMLSHELRNPLAAILNGLYIIDRVECGSEPGIRARQIVIRQVHHMTRLVEDLLDLTRISQGKIQLKTEPVDLGDLVHRVTEDLRSVFEMAEIKLNVVLEAGPIGVLGDPIRLSQVLGNLLNNSNKFTERGGAVSVTLARDAEGQRAILSVTDTGAGIAPEMMSEIFEPFRQCDETLARTQGGLGLGLSLVKDLIELHGGSVAVASNGLNRGVTFSIALPLLAGAVKAEHPNRRIDELRPPRRVLLIEDNHDSADTLRDLLEIEGHDVQVAYSASQGVEMALQSRPDIVFCDIGLPGMDGYQVAESLRANSDLRNTVLVALTGYAMPEDVKRAIKAGFLAHLSKPPELHDMLELIARAAPRSHY